MYGFYPSALLIALLRLSDVSATPTPAISVTSRVQTCTTSWDPGVSDPKEITGFCEFEDVNCKTDLSVMPTAKFGELTCPPQNGKPTPCCLLELSCGQNKGHCQNREKTCTGTYRVPAGTRDMSCPRGGYCCDPPRIEDDFLGDGRGSGRNEVINPFGTDDQPGADSTANSKDLESNTLFYSERPSFGGDLEAFKTNFITGAAPGETDPITPFTKGTSPKGGWDQ